VTSNCELYYVRQYDTVYKVCMVRRLKDIGDYIVNTSLEKNKALSQIS